MATTTLSPSLLKTATTTVAPRLSIRTLKPRIHLPKPPLQSHLPPPPPSPRLKLGTVTSVGHMTHTIRVQHKHQIYDKYLQKHYPSSTTYLVADPDDTTREGDVVEFEAGAKKTGKSVRCRVRGVVAPFGTGLAERSGGGEKVRMVESGGVRVEDVERALGRVEREVGVVRGELLWIVSSEEVRERVRGVRRVEKGVGRIEREVLRVRGALVNETREGLRLGEEGKNEDAKVGAVKMEMETKTKAPEREPRPKHNSLRVKDEVGKIKKRVLNRLQAQAMANKAKAIKSKEKGVERAGQAMELQRKLDERGVDDGVVEKRMEQLHV